MKCVLENLEGVLTGSSDLAGGPKYISWSCCAGVVEIEGGLGFTNLSSEE